MLNIGTKNNTAQTVLTDGLINIGFVYSKYCKRTAQGLPTFAVTSNSITLNGEGKYHITATFVGNGNAVGDMTVDALENGLENGATSSESVSVALTQSRTLVLDFYTMVDSHCVLGQRSIFPKTISFVNSGVSANYSYVSISIDKVV